jgi:hypothetical protein
MGNIGARDQSLGRNAAGVDAGATEVLALDDRDAQALLRKASGERWAGLAGPDDDCVKMIRHRLNPRFGGQAELHGDRRHREH